MLPTRISTTLLAIITIALTIYIPELLLIIIPALAIFMILKSPIQTLSMKKVPIPVKTDSQKMQRSVNRQNRYRELD